MYRCSHCAHENDCMHTILDGADQTQFGLPHITQDTKATSEGLKYKVNKHFSLCISIILA